MSWLEREKPDMARRKVVLQHLALGLQHIHLHGIAHGDVKLENLLISDEVTVVTATAVTNRVGL